MAKNAFDLIYKAVDYWNAIGRYDAPIKVRVSRKYLMTRIKPVERGGPLSVDGHEIIVIERPEQDATI